MRTNGHGRELGRLRRLAAELVEQVEEMTKADQIAHAVAAELDHDRRQRLTFSRKVLGAVAAVILLVPALHDAWAWFG